MAHTELSQQLHHAGRLIKYIGIGALAIQLVAVGLAEMFAALVKVLRLVENSWFWIFVALIVVGILLERFTAESKNDFPFTYRPGAPDADDAGRYTVDDDGNTGV